MTTSLLSLNAIECIWQKGAHNAFTDLCQYSDNFYCSFREASGHVSTSGIIRILQSKDGKSWSLCSTIREQSRDLRDPKFSFAPDGKLILTYYSVKTLPESGQRVGENMVRFSNDGNTWSTGKRFGDTDWWVWRLKWHGNNAYGIGYYYPSNRVQIYHGDPRRKFEVLDNNIFGLSKNGKGYPNESDIQFLDDGTAICILRRDADSCTAQIGLAKAPYKKWRWKDIGYYIGAPKLITVNGKIVLAGRSFTPQEGCKTALWLIDNEKMSLEKIITLPSQGDTSYPGMTISNDKLLVSYYSEHQDKKTKVYLAELTIN